MKSFVTESAAFVLLAFPALFSIINPLGGAFIFLSATQGISRSARRALARRVAIFCFATLVASMVVGIFVLRFFGISMPVLGVAGGIVIALSAWKMLNAEQDNSGRESMLQASAERDVENMAFYPLTMPITTGPGTISVAVALGTRGVAEGNPVLFAFQVLLTAVPMSLLIYLLYASSGRLARAVGPTGTTIIARLSAFLLFCIGIQVMWGGIEELVRGLTTTH
ncbi:MAG: NAAT family transporter [Gammaproteobacteria bacterium]|nr:NAAT family transporter [Gammaproteobacteria bacterium]QOJ32347.1 MAG: NAAT family transporter [Gammaproteobacteria bacterium]